MAKRLESSTRYRSAGYFTLFLEGNSLLRDFSETGNEMITSRLTSKAHTTIPQAVRKALRLRQGDEIVYLIESGRVMIAKAGAKEPVDNPFATFEEWDSDADRKAYADL
jgi:antitoxin PrlF